MPVMDSQIRRERKNQGRLRLGDPGLNRISSVNAVIAAAKVVGVPAAEIAEGLFKPAYEIRRETVIDK